MLKYLKNMKKLMYQCDNNIVAVLKRSFHYVTVSCIDNARDFWVSLHTVECAFWQFPEATVVITVPEYTAQIHRGSWENTATAPTVLWAEGWAGSHWASLPRILGIPGQAHGPKLPKACMLRIEQQNARLHLCNPQGSLSIHVACISQPLGWGMHGQNKRPH